MIVLDTHVLVWWVNGDARLSTAARNAIRQELDRENGRILVSVISAWEIALLVEKGRLSLTMEVTDWLATVAEIDGVELAPVDTAVAVQSVRLPGTFHPDPADRMIVALARRHSVSVVTADAKIREYQHVQSIW